MVIANLKLNLIKKKYAMYDENSDINVIKLHLNGIENKIILCQFMMLVVGS